MTKITCEKQKAPFLASGECVKFHIPQSVDISKLNLPSGDCCEHCLPDGMWWYCVGGKLCPAPLNYTAEAVAAGETVIPMDYLAGYAVGDSFGPPGNYGNITITDPIAVGDMLDVTVAGTTIMVPATTATAADFAAEVGAALLADAAISACVEVVVNGEIIHLFSKKGEFDVIALAAAFSAGAGTATASGTELAPTSLGLITAIDVNNGTLTLDTPLPFDLPKCLLLGSPFDVDSLRGINCCDVCVDGDCCGETTVAVLYSGSIYCNRIRGYSAAMLKALPQLSCAICC